MFRPAISISSTLVALALLATPAEARRVTASAIFATSFAQDSDANYDSWPDYWTRNTSPEYPHYTRIEIVDDPSAENGRSLQVDFDGGGAYLSTPAIPILPKFGYKVYIRARAERLEYTSPRFVIELQNRQQERVQVKFSEPLPADGEWHEVTIDSLRPEDASIDRAVIYLDAPRGRRGDLQGRLSIDQITLERLPSMVVKTNRPYNVYNDFKEVKVECTLSGIREQNPDIRFQLLDETSREINGKSHTEQMKGKLIVEDSFSADEIVGTIGNRPSGYEGTTYWTPKIEDYGFYKIRVEMLRKETGEDRQLSDYDRQLEERVITLAVLPNLPRPDEGEFGWSLPTADKPLSFEVLADLLPRVGVHWAKLPVWYPVTNRTRGEEIIRFAEQTSASGIEVVGILDDPTIEDRDLRDPNLATDVADLLLTDPSFWQPQFEHVMTRLSLRLRWWQLGNDLDTSFYGYSELPKKLSSIRKHLFRFGQDVRLGLGWRWPQEGKEDQWLPSYRDAIWEYEQMSSDPPLTADQLDKHMDRYPRGKASRWVLVDPLMPTAVGDDAVDEKQLSPEERTLLHQTHVREFVRQMVSAKIHGADGIFVANPFSGPAGVMNTDGTPGELLLPWRTTAHLLGGCRYLGRLELPAKSVNHIFENARGEVLMIVWNETPAVEELYLGERIEVLDVWGKSTPLESDENGRVKLEVDRNPSFVLGLHPSVTAWRMAVDFEQLQIPSIFNRPHENLVRGVNAFPQGVNGSFSIFVPERADENEDNDEEEGTPVVGERHNRKWDIWPPRGDLAVGPREGFRLPIHVILDDATYGPQPVRIDFRVEADREYRFSVWRTLTVGLGDVQINVNTKLDDRGQLVVEQTMTNSGPQPADFKCLLYAPPRRRKRTQVVMLGPDGNTKVYQYPQGEQLIDNVLQLRAEEINGSRVLIYRFKAEAGPPEDEADPTEAEDSATAEAATPQPPPPDSANL